MQFAKPLTELFVKVVDYAKENANDPKAIKVILAAIVLCAKIFYSLNAQDLPEEFEDTMNIWIPRFQELLSFTNEHIEKQASDDEITLIEKLKSNIIKSFTLYATRYDEEFAPYLEESVMNIWKLLVQADQSTRHDGVVFSGISFLALISQRQQYKGIFSSNDTIPQIFEKIIMPNSTLRESDVELFEDDADEYIRADLEGSNAKTRRRAAADLIKGLSTFFEDNLAQLASQNIGQLMSSYTQNPAVNWAHKDCALFLLTSLVAKKSTRKAGVTEVSSLVNIQEFFDANVLPEIESNTMNDKQVLRASCIKFCVNFRNQIGKERILRLLVVFTKHLAAESMVLKSYASHAIERMLLTQNMKFSIAEIGGNVLEEMVQKLCTGIHTIQTENQYMMRALMRVLFYGFMKFSNLYVLRKEFSNRYIKRII